MDKKNLTLNQLIERAIRQKFNYSTGQEAYGEIVMRYQDMLFGYAYGLLKDYSLAQDAAQETFINAYGKLEMLREFAAFPGWIRKIARRECLRILNKQAASAVPVQNVDLFHSRQTSPTKAWERKSEVLQIRRIVKGLPEKLRTTIILYYINKYSRREIADFLGVTLEVVKKRLYRAKIQLRKELTDMLNYDLKNHRPSKDKSFFESINLYNTFDSAAKTGQLNLLEQMISDGIDVNSKDSRGRTLLHWAVNCHHIEAVGVLIKNGADMDIPDRTGVTAMQLAKNKNNRLVLDLLFHKKGFNDEEKK